MPPASLKGDKMNCDTHPEKAATYWRKGFTKGNHKIYMCRSCSVNDAHIGLAVYELEPPAEHCEICGVRTGGGMCTTCSDLKDKELSGER